MQGSTEWGRAMEVEKPFAAPFAEHLTPQPLPYLGNPQRMHINLHEKIYGGRKSSAWSLRLLSLCVNMSNGPPAMFQLLTKPLLAFKSCLRTSTQWYYAPSCVPENEFHTSRARAISTHKPEKCVIFSVILSPKAQEPSHKSGMSLFWNSCEKSWPTKTFSSSPFKSNAQSARNDSLFKNCPVFRCKNSASSLRVKACWRSKWLN